MQKIVQHYAPTAANGGLRAGGQRQLRWSDVQIERHKTIELADIADNETRDLVPCSLRQLMITQRIMSGLTFRQLADTCGTSAAPIEEKYYMFNDEIRLINATADYRLSEDGTIEVL